MTIFKFWSRPKFFSLFSRETRFLVYRCSRWLSRETKLGQRTWDGVWHSLYSFTKVRRSLQSKALVSWYRIWFALFAACLDCCVGFRPLSTLTPMSLSATVLLRTVPSWSRYGWCCCDRHSLPCISLCWTACPTCLPSWPGVEADLECFDIGVVFDDLSALGIFGELAADADFIFLIIQLIYEYNKV